MDLLNISNGKTLWQGNPFHKGRKNNHFEKMECKFRNLLKTSFEYVYPNNQMWDCQSFRANTY